MAEPLCSSWPASSFGQDGCVEYTVGRKTAENRKACFDAGSGHIMDVFVEHVLERQVDAIFEDGADAKNGFKRNHRVVLGRSVARVEQRPVGGDCLLRHHVNKVQDRASRDLVELCAGGLTFIYYLASSLGLLLTNMNN
ncbi:hypothetical protein, variant 2 [Aphanomyces invadans]|uniref:Uncharacterized protein n=1 Tax=Aphanomyces invadans TaxID=157072 RepID=A0A024TTF3_9STRA|nr:hypothetical protein, variant 2 [Aphanomyces invadans]XP_008874031.1 hypothetical protein H310_09665 [Aphanomyces invadans]XP_008874032.1 hypothetical protein, variant 1 [Aphanomyces invadans]ETV97322.1 hypothetical protein H310_09665 [Aphanomyces invadans]ETV97323.1 hypothetical protein, variant 1 [Aphanomyces invadans]ETV97324.1 hypothetical protein, variant 2 [Aphanomyces invadans]|eukprot:XP_008874030.1 hypothetical protein, variant 2 [Aphanomyces invadans]